MHVHIYSGSFDREDESTGKVSWVQSTDYCGYPRNECEIR